MRRILGMFSKVPGSAGFVTSCSLNCWRRFFGAEVIVVGFGSREENAEGLSWSTRRAELRSGRMLVTWGAQGRVQRALNLYLQPFYEIAKPFAGLLGLKALTTPPSTSMLEVYWKSTLRAQNVYAWYRGPRFRDRCVADVRPEVSSQSFDSAHLESGRR